MAQKTVILLAMHGMPPRDFPRQDMAEWGRLHSALGQMSGEERERAAKRYEDLERKLRSWPRTEQNDPFHKASHELAQKLEGRTGFKVVTAFSDFCGPTLDEGFDLSAQEKAERVVVITPMMTRGGNHSESDIPKAIEKAKKRFPQMAIHYVWPYADSTIVEFLAQQLTPHLNHS